MKKLLFILILFLCYTASAQRTGRPEKRQIDYISVTIMIRDCGDDPRGFEKGTGETLKVSVITGLVYWEGKSYNVPEAIAHWKKAGYKCKIHYKKNKS